MGFYLQIDTEEPQPLASLTGWGDVIRWVGSLPPDYRALHHLCLYGWFDDIEALTTQLAKAIRSQPPKNAQTKKTLANWMAILKRERGPVSAISVTDGLGDDD